MTTQEIFDLVRSYEEGQKVEISDATNVYQCFDFAYLFSLVLHVPKVALQHLYAYEIFTKPNDTTRQYFDIIANDPNFIPQKGDIGVFDTTVGPAGHVCICTGEGDTNSFKSLDANWAGKSAVTLTTHTYKGFLGVLRAKNLGDTSTMAVPQVNITDQTKLQTVSDGEIEYQAIKSLLEDRKKAVIGQSSQLSAQATQLQDLNSEVSTLNAQLSMAKDQVITKIIYQTETFPKYVKRVLARFA